MKAIKTFRSSNPKLMLVLPAVGALALLMGMASPAGAQSGAGGGVVQGTVTLSPGLTTTCAYQSGNFNPGTLLSGALGDSAGHVFVGQVPVTASFNSAGSPLALGLPCPAGTESDLGGAGVVSNVNSNTTLRGVVGTLDVEGLNGSYLRLGTNVLVALQGPVSLDGAPAEQVTVYTADEFVPTSVPTTPTTSAQFVGVWAGSTALPYQPLNG